MSNGDVNQYRQVMLQVVLEFSKGNSSSFQSGSILREVQNRLNIGGRDAEQLLLTLWGDLFRTGYLAWGYDISNPNPPFCHVTEQGRIVLQQLSRDPANPTGYLAYLASRLQLSSITESYVQEALRSFGVGCYKASAVMIGAAAENLLLEIRDEFIQKMASSGKTPHSDLKDWKIKRILNGVKRELDANKSEIPQQLYDEYEAYWSAFSQQIRTGRNDAGHPAALTLVTFESVHASLLIFPELALLSDHLRKWIQSTYH